jgi:NAD(P)-dependent dehydrogenase (short-subunit alcohol dehydrogenase family)
MMTTSMSGKVAIVTGAGSGIGRAAALLFSARGASVAVIDCDPEGGNETVNGIAAAGGKALFIEADISQSEQVKRMVETTVETYGRLDYAYNNAGIEAGLFPLSDYTEEIWDRTIAVNLKGVWLGMKYEIPAMLKSGGGAIVNTASAAGLIALPNHYAYVASKFGVVGITKVAALEFAGQGIRVNCVCPAIIETPMTDRFVTYGLGTKEMFAAVTPIKRLGLPEEVAASAVWLCSDEASYITGHSLCVDGGYTAQ